MVSNVEDMPTTNKVPCLILMASFSIKVWALVAMTISMKYA
ncbi:hypothetical protein QQG09_06510 [Melissococcus plutonius]|nr:hypothetical protein [Melissococcus plutonius]